MCHQVDGLDDVLEDGLRDEVVEVHAHPARLDALAAAVDLARELVRPLDSMPSNRCPYGPAQEQPPARLDAEQVVQEATTKLWWR